MGIAAELESTSGRFSPRRLDRKHVVSPLLRTGDAAVVLHRNWDDERFSSPSRPAAWLEKLRRNHDFSVEQKHLEYILESF